MNIFAKNALDLLEPMATTSPELAKAYLLLRKTSIEAGIIDFLANPFVRSALGILEKFQSNKRISEAIKLLKEAGEEEEKEVKKKKAYKPDAKKKKVKAGLEEIVPAHVERAFSHWIGGFIEDVTKDTLEGYEDEVEQEINKRAPLYSDPARARAIMRRAWDGFVRDLKETWESPATAEALLRKSQLSRVAPHGPEDLLRRGTSVTHINSARRAETEKERDARLDREYEESEKKKEATETAKVKLPVTALIEAAKKKYGRDTFQQGNCAVLVMALHEFLGHSASDELVVVRTFTPGGVRIQHVALLHDGAVYDQSGQTSFKKLEDYYDEFSEDTYGLDAEDIIKEVSIDLYPMSRAESFLKRTAATITVSELVSFFKALKAPAEKAYELGVAKPGKKK